MGSRVTSSEDGLSIANHPATRLPGPNLLHMLVQQSPPDGHAAIDHLASDGTRRSLSYADLHDAAGLMASRITALAGPRDGSRPFIVPVLIPQGPELYISLLGILRAGGAFCPINLDVPPERARFILEDVAAEVVVTTTDLASRLPRGVHSLLLVDEPINDRELPRPAERAGLGPRDLAYVMYTSGSTGTPKGVGVSHGAATQSLLAHDRHIPQFSRFLQFAAPTFDVSVFEIFFPLLRGKTLVSCARPVMLNDLPATIRNLDVDACELTPTVAGSLLRRRSQAPSLRLLLTIGEMLTPPVVEEFGGSGKRRSLLWAMYGPTEAAIHCTLQPAFAQESSVRNIGTPLDTVSAFILAIPAHDDLTPEFSVLPRGEVGELAVGGHQLADGYLNRPEQTASAFLDTPYGRLYRTGDRARMLPDGSLECLGRIADGQVKLRGQRIELGEVEHAALKTPGCHSAVAAVSDAALVLFCAVDRAGDVAGDVMDSCKRWLPGFMLPKEIVTVDSFPRLASGKVDRKRMVAEYRARLTEPSEQIHHQDELEEQLCRLASQILGFAVSPSQDMFKAGLDSLTSIRLASAAREAGHEIGAVDIIAARTVRVLYARLQSASGSQSPKPAARPAPLSELDAAEVTASHGTLSQFGQPVEAVFPCTPLQASMLAETMADSRAYCNWVELVVPGPVEAVEALILQVAQANEALRTGFIHHDGLFLQVIFEEFPTSSMSITDSIDKQFALDGELDFLRPFRVQLCSSLNSGGTTVLLQLHHAMYDGWSLDLVLSDLAALAHGGPLKHRVQFRAVSAYHRSEGFQSSCDAAREFWAGNLHGFQPPALPILNPDIVQSSGVLSLSLSLEIDPQDLRRILNGIECGPQTIFQAALAWLWSSMVGNEDVVVGQTLSGRTMPITGIEDIIGPCITSVPLRTDFSQLRTISDLVVSIQASNRLILPHSVLPLSQIMQAAGIRAGQALYDVLFVYQESLQSRNRSTGSLSLVAHQDYLETKLLLEIEPKDSYFDCRFTYHPGVFPKAQVCVMAESIKALVSYALDNLDSDISSLRTAFPPQILSAFNTIPTAFTGIPDLAHAVERTVSDNPHKEAVCFADHISDGTVTTTTITYAELNATANRIGWHIRQAGVRQGAVVAIIAEKSIRLYAGILAILKAGCAYLPLLPSTPASRTAAILQQAGAGLCLVDTATREKLSRLVHVSLIDLQSLDLRSTPASFVTASPDPGRLAYIIYTSGSTGVPKGVCLTQLNIMSNLDALSRVYPVGQDSRLLQSCSQAFDVSVFEIFFAWTQGMCLCSGTNDTLFEDLERSIRRLGVTHLSMTPTVASLVDPAKVPRVEFLVTAGEAMTEAVADRWGDKLYQGYGPSETTNICSVKKMGRNQAIRHLGWALENTSAFVLGRASTEPVPFGCLGEFCFGGDQVAQGYLDMEELTSAKFIDHPRFGRLYRSGDLGRMLPDGSMVIVGREDEQVKIRGQRVELNEINEAIRQLANPAGCATIFFRAEETRAQDQVVSFLVPEQREGLQSHALALDDATKQEIRHLFHALASRLPSYMVPSAIVMLSALPATSSGKLDRARLRQVFMDLPKAYLESVSHGAAELDAEEREREWSQVEIQVAGAVSLALNVGKGEVRRWTPLTTLGLDSISAIHLSRHLNRALGRQFPISLILQNASVARLAKTFLDMDGPGSGRKDAPELLPREVSDQISARLEQQGAPFIKILPCTPLQEAMLAAAAGQRRYLNRMLFRVHGDVGRLKQAWDAMCARHDILRTCFVTTEITRFPIAQVVLGQWQPYWHQFDAALSSFDDCITQHVGQVPKALDSLKPAVSFATISQGGGDTYLSFICHHALYDGVAIERLLYEVELCFAGSALPPAPAYDRFLAEALALPASTDAFWLNHLGGYEPKLASHLRVDSPTASSIPHQARELGIPLSPVTARIKDLGTSMLALVQSAWATTLATLLGTSDVCFGNVVSGRSAPVDGIHELVAPCFNTIPIRIDLSRCQRNLDLTKAFQTLNLDLMQYQYTPLRRIQSLLSQNGDRRLFDTLLLLQQPPRPLDQSLWTLVGDEGEMDVPLVCEVIPNTDIDCLVIKLHTIESISPFDGASYLILNLFTLALRNFLEHPGSQASLRGLNKELQESLSRIERRPPTRTHSEAQPDGANVEHWTTVESSIRSILAALAPRSLSKIRRKTTIYQLGLDSISAVQIASSLRRAGFQVLASDVIENPTCESLARYIHSRDTDSGRIAEYRLADFQTQVKPQIHSRGISSDEIEALIPCTPLQSAMVAQSLKSKGRDYVNHLSLEFGERASAASLAEAWRAVCCAHPILRTGILPVDHADSAFAMIQYYEPVFNLTADTISLGGAATFDLGNWRLESSRDVLDAMHQGLWRVAVVESQPTPTMHIAIHHALYDAYSLRVILDDLSRAALGHQIFSPIGPWSATIDILSQASKRAEESAEFWKSQAERIVVNRFPVMTPLHETSRVLVTESMDSSVPLEKLEAAVSDSGYTLQVIFQAAWTRILSAYHGEDSVVFGVVLSGRNSEATRDAVFPCITTLPVIGANCHSNRSLLAQMLQYNTELFKQQHQSLGRIQNWLGRPDSQLFDTLLVYQKFDTGASSERRWRILDESAHLDYPVSIEVEPKQSGLLGYHLDLHSDVLPIEQARLLLRQFDEVVRQLAFEPDGHEAELYETCPELFSVLPPEQPEIPTRIRFLHEFVEHQARETPAAIALHYVERFEGDAPLGRRWTYKELDDNGNRVGRMLHASTQPGDIVAVYFDKCPEAYFSILGILKAGCAFVALDPGAPRSRNEFIIRDSGATAVVTSRERQQDLGLAVAAPVIAVDENMAYVSPEPLAPCRTVDARDVCYCLYTSGTTGTPKGCEITHDNAVQCMLAFRHIFSGRWQADSRWLQFASLHFDVSVLEQYWSWSVGITLIAAPRDVILEDLAGTISRLEITHIDLTPSLARLLHPDDVPSLCRGVFITGGESLKEEILDVWGDKRVIYNFYGPTEATIGVTVFPQVPAAGRATNIGRQFVNVGSYVLKPGTEQPVLRGGVGELCVSGRLVGKGYLGRKDLTSEKFPVLQRFGERVYRTGDLVRVLHDGCFDFLGRADDQVKLRGQRLELGEINQAIRRGVEAVTDSATLVVRNEAQQKDFLVSFIVAEDGDKCGGLGLVEGPAAARLCWQAREACRSKLPAFMVPSYILQLPFIPLSANNKVEIRELRRLFSSLSQDKLVALSNSHDQTRNTLSAAGMRISKAIAAMQDIDATSVTPQTSIFELGIDSISVLRLSRSLRSEGFEHAHPSLILRNPVVGDLAAALEEQRTSSGLDSVTATQQLVRACAHRYRALVCRELSVRPDQIEYIAPCSPLQEGMISRSAVKAAYFNTFRLTLSSTASIQLLHDAYRNTFDSLSVLRTKFVVTADRCLQVALKDQTLPWYEAHLDPQTTVEDVISKTRGAWVARNQRTIVQPVELVLVHGTDRPNLILHIFHGLYDANSFALWLDLVATEYMRLSDNSTQRRDQVPGPRFVDALCHGPLQDWTSSTPFWVEHLTGAAKKQFSTQSPASSTTITTTITTSQRQYQFQRLEELRTRLGVTHQAIVQAAWVAVLAKYFSADPTIGIMASGRSIDLDGADRVVGPLFNTIPFHSRIETPEGQPATSWTSLIRQCHDFNTAVIPFQHTPLRDIQKWCADGLPLFDTLFSFQRQERAVAEDCGLWTLVEAEPKADYPLALEATLGLDGNLRLLLVGHRESGPFGKLEALMGDLVGAFDDISRCPDGVVLSPASLDASAMANPSTLNEFTNHQHPDPGFTWTEEAVIIRDEMAALAGADPELVTESTPIFGIGLDSIDVIKLAARLRRRGIELKPSELIKAQTIRAFSALIRSNTANSNHNVASASVRSMEKVLSALREDVAKLGQLDDDDIVLPTTPLQDSMLVEMIESDFALYFNHDVIGISASVDVHRLKEAWRSVIASLPIFRTTFVPVENPSLGCSYCQVIGKKSSAYMSEVSLNSETELAEVCDTAARRARMGAARSDLVQLVFASIHGRQFLVLSIAHALYDGWSLDLVRKAVQAAYEDTYRPPDVESYVGELKRVLLPEDIDAPAFWSGFLQGATPTILAGSRLGSQDGNLTHRAEATSSLSAAEISSFCRARALTLQVLGQACWAALLAAETGSLDVTFGVVLSCRDTEALEELAFPTMNTVAMRSILHGTVSSWLQYMQENSASIRPYQHFPLREAQKLARANGPLFDTLFIHQPRFSTGIRNDGETLMQSVGGSSAIGYPVCVEMEPVEESLVWRIACDGAYVSQEQGSRILRDLERVLTYLVRSPEANVLSITGGGVSIAGQPPVAVRAALGTCTSGTHQAEPQRGERNAWSPLETAIRDVLAEVSGAPVTAISKSNNIYHLGLDSISATKVVSLLRQRDITVRFRDLLKASSIADMANLAREVPPAMSTQNGAGGEGRSIELARLMDADLSEGFPELGFDGSEIEEVLPATPMQVHMLSVWQNTGGEVFYPCFKYTLTGKFEAADINAAWSALVAETPILRTVFVSTKSRSMPMLQLVVRDTALAKASVTSADLTQDGAMTGALTQPYRLLRANRSSGESWLLQLRIHHALYDAVSLPAIMGRFDTLCREGLGQDTAGRSFSWRNILATRYTDGRGRARREFWTEYLAGVEPISLSLGGLETCSRVGVVKRSALRGLSRIRELCKEKGVSLQALVFATIAEFVASSAVARDQTRPQRVVFGIYLANRTETDDRGANSYPFLRLLPIRAALDHSIGLLQVAAQIQNDIHDISSPDNVEVGLWEIKDWTGVVVDVFVNFLANPPAAPEGAPAKYRPGLHAVTEPIADSAPILPAVGDNCTAESAPGITGNPVRDAYPDAIDIEVSVDGEDLAIGVFGPGARLSTVGGHRLIEGMVELLEAVV